ncbi:ty3-gypsy retroelement transposase [Cucumis melo var. makuwa]|uniref:Ty3-gypsy retroelement transposase n=1 Tax=Cucumis melo var. makuwa TaxID=1194695 RepID=A0A5D3E8T0_CUCMM|nr:ty3-gypsy retroelement transposase [Cucumis melo var. makuwa]
MGCRRLDLGKEKMDDGSEWLMGQGSGGERGSIQIGYRGNWRVVVDTRDWIGLWRLEFNESKNPRAIIPWNWEEHLQHLEMVLKVLRKRELYAIRKKCSFSHSRVEYLGRIISGRGYYRRFVQHYGTIAAPLMQLLKLGAFKWTEEAQEAFLKLQNVMMTLLVLALPDFSLPFEIETDALP